MNVTSGCRGKAERKDTLLLTLERALFKFNAATPPLEVWETMLQILRLVVTLENKHYKKTTLGELDNEVDVLRHLVRLAADPQYTRQAPAAPFLLLPCFTPHFLFLVERACCRKPSQCISYQFTVIHKKRNGRTHRCRTKNRKGGVKHGRRRKGAAGA